MPTKNERNSKPLNGVLLQITLSAILKNLSDPKQVSALCNIRNDFRDMLPLQFCRSTKVLSPNNL
jgi:hypothetical protein